MKKLLLFGLILLASLAGAAQASFQDADLDKVIRIPDKPVDYPLALLSVSNDEKQINKGDMIINGNVSFYSWFNHYESGTTSSSTSGVHFGINPTLLFFLSDGLALGSRVSAGFSTSEGNFSYFVGLGPEFRYYFDFGLFMKLGASYDLTHYETSSNHTIEVEPGIGYAIFLNPHVALEPGFFYNLSFSNYDYTTSTSKYINHNIGIHVGLSIFL